MGLLQGRGIVDTVAGHGHHLAVCLEGPDNSQLLLGWHAGKNTAALHQLTQLFLVTGLQHLTKHHLLGARTLAQAAALWQQPNALGNGLGRERMVAGDHHGPDAGLAATIDRFGHFRTGWIQLGHQAQ